MLAGHTGSRENNQEVGPHYKPSKPAPKDLRVQKGFP